MSFLNTYGLTQHVKEPTRERNTLDLIASNIPDRINRTKVIPGISDHHVVYTEVSLKVNRRRTAPRTAWVYKRADWLGLTKYIDPLLKPLATSSDSVENLWTAFKNVMTSAANKFIPSRKVKARESRPWISSKLREKMTLRDRLHQKSKHQGKAKIELRFKKMKNEVQADLRREQREYVTNILSEEDTNTANKSKKFWTYVKHKRSDNAGIGTLRSNGKLITNPTDKAEALNAQFQSVFSTQSAEPIKQPTEDNLSMPNIKVV